MVGMPRFLFSNEIHKFDKPPSLRKLHYKSDGNISELTDSCWFISRASVCMSSDAAFGI